MNGQHLNPAEALREPATAMAPDPRTGMFAGQAALSLAAHHADIARVQLSPAVPEPIAIQYETARNLYLYAWHVYRFYMVAATQALTTLEFGLRERLPAQLPKPYQRTGQRKPMLAGMLRYAIDQGLVRNDGFRRWHETAAHRARERRSLEAIQTMIDQDLEYVEIDDEAPVEVSPQDQQWDLVAILSDSLPSLRNQLAHGSPMLTRQVLGTLELVSEILSQLYPAQSATDSKDIKLDGRID
ncbi:hypothetical protein BurJ1DRAFT_2164 [Burkholderiales bacterium JOSHI_001]|nr:hypothetical protein BurJ1DRAFT_2164 [Burkholderiales bacterium JOSHI_001]